MTFNRKQNGMGLRAWYLGLSSHICVSLFEQTTICLKG